MCLLQEVLGGLENICRNLNMEVDDSESIMRKQYIIHFLKSIINAGTTNHTVSSAKCLASIMVVYRY